jgi:hypothetical protein
MALIENCVRTNVRVPEMTAVSYPKRNPPRVEIRAMAVR